MKKYYKVVIILMLGFMTFEPMIQSCKAETAGTKITLIFDIEWGRRSRDCRGFGICRFHVDGQIELERPVKVSLENNIMELEVPLDIAKKNPNQFDNDMFIMEEDFEVDREISKEFGSQKSLILPAGKYRMKRLEDAVYIRIPVK
ncbi:MAG TPA: hypothetical protein PKM97_06585 [Bacteroidia bacterium]|nr:hypothetical protein [Bacteroidia bacterium]